MKDKYKKQVALLLDILPEIAKEEVFALHVYYLCAVP